VRRRQWFDWSMFLGTMGVDALAGRRCALTQCRLLRISPPALLPTAMSKALYLVLLFLPRVGSPLFRCVAHIPSATTRHPAMFYLRMENPMDAFILTDVFHVLYTTFWASYAAPYLADASELSGPTPVQPSREAALAQAVRSMSRQGPQPDNAEVSSWLSVDCPIAANCAHPFMSALSSCACRRWW
jgi:hypothetical protein